MSKKQKNGFTLIEILIAAVIIGMVSFLMSPVLNKLFIAQQQHREQKQNLIDKKIAQILLDYAELYNDNHLIAPFTNAGLKIYSGFDVRGTTPESNNLISLGGEHGLDPIDFNSDGTSTDNVRTYVMLNQVDNINLYGNTGPQVIYRYEIGSVYGTKCSRFDSTCNPNTNGIGGKRELLTTVNKNTWPADPLNDECFSPVIFSTLNLQKKKMRLLLENLKVIKQHTLDYFRAKLLVSAPGDTANFYPTDTATSEAGKAPAANEGCRDGWYNLYTSSILNDMGLNSVDYGLTPWGGIIEYCRKYDPSGTIPEATPPHYSAIRFSSDPMASGAAKDPNNVNDIIISF